MSFGLKNAPSKFQQAMTTIFQPILHSTLVYIDGIILFSPNIEAHLALLHKFHDLVKQYGIILSQKKMIIAQTSINFLGLIIKNGQNLLIATHLHQDPRFS